MSPSMILSSVVFPQPLGPMRLTNSPGRIARFISSSTSSDPPPSEPYRFTRSRNWMDGELSSIASGSPCKRGLDAAGKRDHHHALQHHRQRDRQDGTGVEPRHV